MPKELEKKPKIHNSTRLGDLKGVALRVQGVAPKVGEKGETTLKTFYTIKIFPKD